MKYCKDIVTILTAAMVRLKSLVIAVFAVVLNYFGRVALARATDLDCAPIRYFIPSLVGLNSVWK